MVTKTKKRDAAEKGRKVKVGEVNCISQIYDGGSLRYPFPIRLHMKRTGGQNELEHLKRFEPSGFFVLRTPLLAFDELLAWGEGLEAPAALDDPAGLAEALARDHLRLRDRLSAIFSRPAVREALFIAAPELEELLDLWVGEPQNKRVERVELALARYLLRMAGRATPFGLFAGCSVGNISDETRLVIGGQSGRQRHTRLDMDYLFALAEALGGEESLRNAFIYCPNSSLYSAVGRVRYVESRLKDQIRSYHLVSAEDTDFLSATLARAEDGATSTQLAAALAAEGIPLTEAERYIAELIENQVLIPDLALTATGLEPIHPLIDQLSDLARRSPLGTRAEKYLWSKH